MDWIRFDEKKPPHYVSVLGHMTDGNPFPTVRECYLTEKGVYFPALCEIREIDLWAEIPCPEENYETKSDA